jgi:hypothetical protein
MMRLLLTRGAVHKLRTATRFPLSLHPLIDTPSTPS